jgi:hypothetical protein
MTQECKFDEDGEGLRMSLWRSKVNILTKYLFCQGQHTQLYTKKKLCAFTHILWKLIQIGNQFANYENHGPFLAQGSQ